MSICPLCSRGRHSCESVCVLRLTLNSTFFFCFWVTNLANSWPRDADITLPLTPHLSRSRSISERAATAASAPQQSTAVLTLITASPQLLDINAATATDNLSICHSESRALTSHRVTGGDAETREAEWPLWLFISETRLGNDLYLWNQMSS